MMNVVMIIADQVSARAMGYWGNSQVKTPNIDRLAEKSLNLSRATCQAPICMPSRASFNTGLYPQTVSVNENPYVLHSRFKTLAEYMTEAGYYTGGFGHLGGDGLERGYAECCDMIDNPLSAAWAREQKVVTGDGGKPHSYTAVLPFPEEHSFDGLVTELSVEFLRKQQGRNKPFFLQSALYKPHTPWIVPQKYIDLYDPAALELPATWTGEDMACKHPFMSDNMKAIGMAALTENARKRSLQFYYSAISFVDDKVGRILDAIEESGHADDTIIIFMADHGDFGLEHGTAGKMGAFYDCLVNIPLLIHHPGDGFRRNERDDSPVELVDLLPTILDLCGIEATRSLAGNSLRPLLTGAGQWKRRCMISQVIGNNDRAARWRRGETILKPLLQDPFAPGPLGYTVSGDMVIKDGYKLIHYKDGFTELYNLTEDPNEVDNLSGYGEQAARELELTRELLSWELDSIAMGERQSPLPYHAKASSLHWVPEALHSEKMKWENLRGK